jgi:glycosyltransferase involved in cell wall biosynthesis
MEGEVRSVAGLTTRPGPKSGKKQIVRRLRNATADKRIEVSILLPCRNEEVTIKDCLKEADSALREASVMGELVVVDNGSTDRSAQIARQAGARVIRCEIPGYGAALDCGIHAAKGQYILMLDADGSYDPVGLPLFLKRLRDGDDMVIGNRFLGGIQPGAMPWKNRYLGNPVLSFLGRWMFGLSLGDFHCGIRAFRREAILKLGLQGLGMEYATEMIVRAGLTGLRIGEVPVVLRRDRRGRPSHLRPWRDGWRHLRFMLLFSPRWLFLVPGLALGCGAFALGAYASIGGQDQGREIFYLLSFLGITAGYQFFLFGMLTRVFGVENGFLPEPEGYRNLFRRFNLERGILAGLLGMLAGTLLLFLEVASESRGAEFSWPKALGAGLLLSMGLQTLLSSFLFSFLGISFRMKKNKR